MSSFAIHKKNPPKTQNQSQTVLCYKWEENIYQRKTLSILCGCFWLTKPEKYTLPAAVKINFCALKKYKKLCSIPSAVYSEFVSVHQCLIRFLRCLLSLINYIPTAHIKRLTVNRLAILVPRATHPVFHMVHMIEIVRQGKVDFPPQMIVSERVEFVYKEKVQVLF